MHSVVTGPLDVPHRAAAHDEERTEGWRRCCELHDAIACPPLLADNYGTSRAPAYVRKYVASNPSIISYEPFTATVVHSLNRLQSSFGKRERHPDRPPWWFRSTLLSSINTRGKNPPPPPSPSQDVPSSFSDLPYKADICTNKTDSHVLHRVAGLAIQTDVDGVICCRETLSPSHQPAPAPPPLVPPPLPPNQISLVFTHTSRVDIWRFFSTTTESVYAYATALSLGLE